jgi:hypothetical protein
VKAKCQNCDCEVELEDAKLVVASPEDDSKMSGSRLLCIECYYYFEHGVVL